jgi:hypothetical protein
MNRTNGNPARALRSIGEIVIGYPFLWFGILLFHPLEYQLFFSQLVCCIPFE